MFLSVDVCSGSSEGAELYTSTPDCSPQTEPTWRGRALSPHGGGRHSVHIEGAGTPTTLTIEQISAALVNARVNDKTEDQELEPGNLEDDVVLKDTIQAAAWCQLQSFKNSVSLPEVIGMEGWEQMAASTQRKSHDGGDEEETWKPFQFSFRLHTDYELFCVEMMDRRNLKVFASFESNTSPPPHSSHYIC
ncbi:unnamed protein product [Boreogadus saida]